MSALKPQPAQTVPSFLFPILSPHWPALPRSAQPSEDSALNLEDLGWNSFFEKQLSRHHDDNLTPARVSFQGRGLYRLLSARGELWGELGGTLSRELISSGDFPVCGDWVLADNISDSDRTVIRFLLPRMTSFSRKRAGTALGPQIVATNVDTVCLVSGLDSDFNPRRIERYLTVAWESGARPVIVLNKTDVCREVSRRITEVTALAPGVDVIAVSATEGSGIDDIRRYAGPGQTIAFLGSSGVGKSSLVNSLLGRSAQKIHEIDPSTGRGLHTTTTRELFLLPTGGLIMDTPGMREIQIWASDAGLDTAFEDIAVLAEGCRFRDCTHQSEPGCLVRDAIDQGELQSERLANYHKLSREADYIELKTTHSVSWVEKERWKKIARAARKLKPRY
mgnify:CR=1 FL=1